MFVCLGFFFLCIALAVLELVLHTRLAFELRDPPASVSQVLGLKTCATTAQLMEECDLEASLFYRVRFCLKTRWQKVCARVHAHSGTHRGEKALH